MRPSTLFRPLGAAAVAVALLALAPVGAGAAPDGRPGKPTPRPTVTASPTPTASPRPTSSPTTSPSPTPPPTTSTPPVVRGGSVSPSTITAGQLANQTIHLSAPAPAGGLWLWLSVSDVVYTDFVGSYLVVPEGRSSFTFPARFTAGVSGPTSITVSASAPGQGYVPAGKVTVVPPDPAVQGVKDLRFDQRVVLEGATVTGTVELTAPAAAGGVNVDLWSNSSYGGVRVAVPPLVVVPAGATTASFTVPVWGDGVPNEGNPGAYLGTSRDSAPVAAVPVSTFAVGPGFVRIGGTVDHVVGLGDVAGPDGARVALSIDLPGVTVPAYVDVPPGSPGAVFPVTGAADLDPSRFGTLTATWNGRTTTVTVYPG
ncbi:hypothetical protein GA0070611_5675 [Micromonospora auratinigra]|uniref:Uncharacterized protein n=1 Tax=Micromonospora auratinigra TaxID=261654 RepID=A0A1A9A8T3_9ACTN|nr:hypothetical protein GA0070611_5675 [Micromonospora auratinigra]